MKLTMKNVAIFLGVLWVLMMITTAINEDSEIMPVIGALMFVGVILLIITFFQEKKQINKRQKLRDVQKISKEKQSTPDKGYERLEEKVKNPNKIFIISIFIIFGSPFFKDQSFGPFLLYVALSSNAFIGFYNLFRWTKNKKINKRDLLISSIFVVLSLAVMWFYFPNAEF
jgi:peptidoglycan biosynthesis protein MviN/MurJ (putative lipid II flippase)